jgi:hypothetical protein
MYEMIKEMYDASIHVGQFSLDEDIRIRCKNAQVRISSKEAIKNNVAWSVIGVCTFWENTESDNVIWATLKRQEQDVFYPWMDVFHTIKHIEKIRDSNIIAVFDVVSLQKNLGCGFSNALILAWAILTNTNTVYTLYEELLKNCVVEYMQQKHDILVTMPPFWEEKNYIDSEQSEEWKLFDLELLYQQAVQLYKMKKIDLLENLFWIQSLEKRI